MAGLGFVAAALTAAACGGSDNTTNPPVSTVVRFTANLTPGGEPSVTGNPTSTGQFTATLDTATNVFTWTLTFQGLTSPLKFAHIHGPFTPGTSGSAAVILNFDPASNQIPGETLTGVGTATSGSATGSTVLNSSLHLQAITGDSLRTLLLAGLAYVNVHSNTNPGGEIRAQIVKQ